MLQTQSPQQAVASPLPETIPQQPARLQQKTKTGWWVYVLLTLGLIIMIGPFVWMVMDSFKGQAELAQLPPTWYPVAPTLGNYSKLFTDLNFPQYFLNSVILAVSVTVLNLLFCSMLGYALAKLRFRGRNALFLLVLATLMVPSTVTLVPLFVLMSKLQLVNTLT